MRLLSFWVPSFLILSLAAITVSLPIPLPFPPPHPLPPPFPFPPPHPLPPSFPSPPPFPLPPSKPGKPRIVRCRTPFFPLCFNVPFRCPPSCPRTCLVDCSACKPVCSCDFPGAVCQDPRFVGGDGNTFYFHGRKDQDFCLVSDANLHVNGHFIGKRNPKLNRDFTWVQSIGIMFDKHKLLVAAKKTSIWDYNVDRLEMTFDGNSISIPTKEGTKWDSPNAPNNVIMMRTSNANGVMVEVLNNFRVTIAVVPITAEESRVHDYGITKDDCFAHLEIGFKFFNLTDFVDGVLGQTYRRNYISKTKVNVPMPVMGGAHKFLASGLFAIDCVVSRFGGNISAIKKKTLPQHYSLNCKSGKQGSGLVCKG